jgi:predicted solute-binding protein
MTLDVALLLLRDVVEQPDVATDIETAMAVVLLELMERARHPVLSAEDAHTLAMMRPIR